MIPHEADLLPLKADSLLDAPGSARERMRPSRLLVASYNDIISSVQEKNLIADTGLIQKCKHISHLVIRQSASDINAECYLRIYIRRTGRRDPDKRHHQLNRQIVNTVIIRVLQVVENSCLSCAGHTGHYD